MQDYLLDAPVSVGDGFSFSGGKKKKWVDHGCVENMLTSQAFTFCDFETFV